MNPITFNDKFAQALDKSPNVDTLRQHFAGWQGAPLFDYETTWEKENSLTQEGTTLQDIELLQWPFDTLRLCLTERAVPFYEGKDGTTVNDYVSHFVAKKQANGFGIDVLLWWREARPTRDAVMMHVFTWHDDAGGHTAATLFVPRAGGWAKAHSVPSHLVHTMAGSAVASLGSFLIDAAAPTNHIALVRPVRGQRSVQWQQARAHYTLIAHGHPANKKSIAEGERVVVSRELELQRLAHNRRGHWRTYRHERFTYARNKTRWIKQAWCGPKEWMDGGGKQIYKILEPVTDECAA